MTAPQERYDSDTGLLSSDGMEQAIDIELARAARHEFPLSLVLVEVSPAPREADTSSSRVAAKVSEALLGSVRTEDRVGRVGELRFAVLATEGGNGDALAQRLADHVRRHLGKSGWTGLAVAAAAVDCQHDEMTRDQLVRQAETEITRAILAAVGEQAPLAPRASPRSFGDLPRAI